MSDLPKGWEASTLGEICSEPQYGWTSRAAKTGTLRYVRTSDISNERINWENVPFCSEVPDNPEKYKVQRDDILVSRAGSVGVSCRIKEVPYEAVFASYLIRFKPLSGIEPKYVEYYLKSDEYWRSISDFTAGIALPNVNASKLARLEIPLPPLNEQRRIVAKLEKLLSKVDACKERLEKIPTILKRFRQSVLSAACSGRLTADWREKNSDVESAVELLRRIQEERKRKYDEECAKAKAEGKKKPEKDHEIAFKEFLSITGWAEAKLDNLIYIAARIGWRGLKAEEYTEDGPLFLSVHNLNYGEEVDFRDTFHVSMERYDESPEIQLQDNDILLAKDGAGIGKIGIVKNLNQLATVNSSLLVISSREAFVPKYLFYFLSGPELQNLAKTRITGSATPHLFQKDIKEFNLLVPPLPEQQEIVRRVEALFKVADRIEERYKKARGYVDKLTQAILVKAFRGELVPQDPNDEPASVLLGRIREEREMNRNKSEGGKTRNHKRKQARKRQLELDI